MSEENTRTPAPLEPVNWIGLWTFVRRESQRFLRVPIQTLITPWISALLFIFIFGFVVGSRIESIGGVRYLEFVLPGVLMLNLISAAFGQTSSSLYFQRFARHIEEILVAPLSHVEMVVGYVIGGIMRGMVVGLGVFALAIFFGAATLTNVWLFLFYVLGVSMAFSFIGLLVGLWAEQFEHLQILNTFGILPLSFLGGMFNTLDMMPELIRPIIQFNPFFYFIDGTRFAMVGIHEASITLGVAIVVLSNVVLGVLVWHLFSRGWKLRE
jgi:ABC-2 type transport system permease protein